ncbi:hypothetical protein GCM10009856_41960 [Mycolicibacterium llatzerense]
MSSSFEAGKTTTCGMCHRENEMLMHVYEQTGEVLVFGHECSNCHSPLPDVAELLTTMQAQFQMTIHYADSGACWCLDCDAPTQVDPHGIFDHLRQVHPLEWARMQAEAV